MTLVDTSAWIHALRKNGDPDITAKVRHLLESGEAAWCSMVKLELWNGARGVHEKRVLKEMEASLNEVDICASTWSIAYDLARLARSKGHTIPSTDLLISACAREHGLDTLHDDADFEVLRVL